MRPRKSMVSPDYLKALYATYQGKCKLIIGNLNAEDDIITYDPKFRNVIELLFGDWFMCFNEESAKKISARKNG